MMASNFMSLFLPNDRGQWPLHRDMQVITALHCRAELAIFTGEEEWKRNEPGGGESLFYNNILKTYIHQVILFRVTTLAQVTKICND